MGHVKLPYLVELNALHTRVDYVHEQSTILLYIFGIFPQRTSDNDPQVNKKNNEQSTTIHSLHPKNIKRFSCFEEITALNPAK